MVLKKGTATANGAGVSSNSTNNNNNSSNGNNNGRSKEAEEEDEVKDKDVDDDGDGSNVNNNDDDDYNNNNGDKPALPLALPRFVPKAVLYLVYVYSTLSAIARKKAALYKANPNTPSPLLLTLLHALIALTYDYYLRVTRYTAYKVNKKKESYVYTASLYVKDFLSAFKA